ncbi:uncharacterized protein LOC107614759 [Arachis ipaensis]|uniref:uncharacterized protein LOC107614759 n=1 Tax=Arachis ipaensis TaxID=130454 RepID=UPI0007AF138F|nr:uncharacterized protein LOC107614759 [Arachis ipaensis]XP_025628830.1 uncharacterized protein LOC112722065 [Arachis hypogaea]
MTRFAEANYVKDLPEIFQQLLKYNMKLNPDKCAFGVQSGKFLGFILTCRGIEANLEKCRAVLNMRSPKTVKEIHQLTGRLAALARFLPRIAHRSHHFFKNLRKQQEFHWTEECEKAFTELKAILSAPPILQTPEVGKPFYLYLSITDHAISFVLVTEAEKQQHSVYFVSKSLQNAEICYPKLEKLALALVTTARRLRHYFQSHTIVVRIEQLLRQILTKPELARRLIKWSIELSEYDIQYQSRGAIKSQALADFIAELTAEEQDPKNNTWTLYVDGASNSKGSGAGILLEDKHGAQFEQSLQFTFHASNNQAEYETLIAGLRLAQTMGITYLNVKCDSLLVVQQVTGIFQVKDPLLEKYNVIVSNLVKNVQKFNISHIPREQNDRADIFSKLATIRSQTTPSILSQLTLEEPSVILTSISSISQEDDWRSPFITYLQTGNIPSNVQNQRKFKRRASFYTMLEADLYKRGFTRPLLRCLNTAEAKLTIDEVHKGVCGTHIGGRSLAAKILRVGYYWPTLQQDCMNKVKHCDHCQRHAPIIHTPAEQLHASDICWPFNKWGLDILGPFPPAPGQVKFLIVAIDYFTKWIEATPLAKITSEKMISFV